MFIASVPYFYFKDADKAANNGNVKPLLNKNRLLAAVGDSDAQYYLGNIYEKGDGVEKSYVDAFEWFQMSAEKGSDLAQYKIAYMYEHATGVRQNYPLAIKWYKKVADSLNVGAGASYRIGLMYEKGMGVDRDYSESLKWYKKSSDTRGGYGEYISGFTFDNGTALSQYRSGLIYEYSGVVNRHYLRAEESVQFYKKLKEGAVSLTDQVLTNMRLKLEYASLQEDLNNVVLMGSNRKADLGRAYEWYRKAAKSNVPDAEYRWGLMCKNGLGIKRDPICAFYRFKKAAEQNVVAAQMNLGAIYIKGNFLQESDYFEAFHWFQKAAEKGDSDGQYRIALMYEKGMGVRQNIISAKEWYGKSCDNEYSEGCEEYARLNKQ